MTSSAGSSCTPPSTTSTSPAPAAGSRARPRLREHTYATTSLARGVDLHALRRVLGHARLTSTETYLDLATTHLTQVIDRAYGYRPGDADGTGGQGDTCG